MLDVNQIDISRRLIDWRIGVVIGEKKAFAANGASGLLRISSGAVARVRSLHITRVHDAANGPASDSWQRSGSVNRKRSRSLFRAVLLPSRVRVAQAENASFEDDGNVIVVVVVVENATHSEERGRLLCDWKRTMFPRRVVAPDVTTVRAERGDDSGRVPVNKRSDRHR